VGGEEKTKIVAGLALVREQMTVSATGSFYEQEAIGYSNRPIFKVLKRCV